MTDRGEHEGPVAAALGAQAIPRVQGPASFLGFTLRVHVPK